MNLVEPLSARTDKEFIVIVCGKAGCNVKETHTYDEPLWGTWYIKEAIGSGSFGTVYKVQQEVFGHTYDSAVKHISLPKDEAELRNLEDDIQSKDPIVLADYLQEEIKKQSEEFSTQRLFAGHPNIVQVYDILCLNKKGNMLGYDLFIRMEYLNRISTRISFIKPDEKEAMRLAMDICTALSAIHSKNIVHRDVKPQNILVTDDGVYKLADFGSTRFMSGAQTYMSMKGGMYYTAPEIFQGRTADHRSDIYSLGIVLYMIMNQGLMPFVKSDGSVPQNDANGRLLVGDVPPAPSEASQAFSEIILKACAHDPDKRYATAEEMKAAIKSVYDEKQQKPKTKYNKWIVILTIMLLALGISGLSFGLHQLAAGTSVTLTQEVRTKTGANGTCSCYVSKAGAVKIVNLNIRLGSSYTPKVVQGQDNILAILPAEYRPVRKNHMTVCNQLGDPYIVSVDVDGKFCIYPIEEPNSFLRLSIPFY